jgi:hypothetical protein
MPLPKVTKPAQGAIHRHGDLSQKVFYWDAGSPQVVPTHWRLKVGGTPGSGNYFTGTVAEPTHQLSVTFSTMPPTGKTVYTLVEWSTDRGATFPNQGDITSFTCNP